MPLAPLSPSPSLTHAVHAEPDAVHGAAVGISQLPCTYVEVSLGDGEPGGLLGPTERERRDGSARLGMDASAYDVRVVPREESTVGVDAESHVHLVWYDDHRLGLAARERQAQHARLSIRARRDGRAAVLDAEV